MAKIVVLGDLAPLGRADPAFVKGDFDWFSSGLEPYWSDADFRVVNLECPMIESETPIEKVGPCLGVKANSAAALKEFSLVGLANNHVMDHGEAGLQHTMSLLDTAGIPSFGAGLNREKASRPHVVEIDGVTVGFIGWVHHEFCIAGEDSPGAAPIEVTTGLPIIEELRENCDFIVLLYHGGPEHFPYPTPTQRKNCRFFAERGVDVILCQHSHIIGAVEQHAGSTILYGQGNYCFDLKGKESLSHWTDGLLCSLNLEKGKAATVEMIPIVHSRKDDPRPQLADEAHKREVLARQQELSRILGNHDCYNREWGLYARSQAEAFFYGQYPFGRVGRRLLKMLPPSMIPGAKHRMLRNLNRIECEAHADAIAAGFKSWIGIKEEL